LAAKSRAAKLDSAHLPVSGTDHCFSASFFALLLLCCSFGAAQEGAQEDFLAQGGICLSSFSKKKGGFLDYH